MPRVIYAAILDRFDLLPLISGLPLEPARLTRRRDIPGVWDIYFVLTDEDDVGATCETFESCTSPRIGVIGAAFRAADCEPDELRITFYVRAD